MTGVAVAVSSSNSPPSSTLAAGTSTAAVGDARLVVGVSDRPRSNSSSGRARRVKRQAPAPPPSHSRVSQILDLIGSVYKSVFISTTFACFKQSKQNKDQF
jgi:hypothetical protein